MINAFIGSFFSSSLILLGFIIYYFSKSQDFVISCIGIYKIYIPVFGTFFLITLLMRKKRRISVFLCYLYIILIMLSYLCFREYLVPWIKERTNYYAEENNTEVIFLEEFDDFNKFPIQIGVILEKNKNLYSFGRVAKLNRKTYLISNIVLEIGNLNQNRQVIYSQYGKIADNKLILYKAIVNKFNKNSLYIAKELPKNYILPVPFHMESIFDLWNAKNLDNIRILPIIMYNTFEQSMLHPIISVLGIYLSGFILLCVLCSIGVALYHSIRFTRLQIIGAIAVLISLYPLIFLLYYYVSLLIQFCINLFVKY